jgi:hypothetical protein
MLRGEPAVDQRRGLAGWIGQQSRWQGGIGQQTGPRESGFPAAARDVAGRAGSAFSGATEMAARAGQSAASVTREAPAMARGAASRAGSAFSGAAGMAARAGQSAASVTRDASSALAHRMADVSSRMAQDDESLRPGGRERWSGGRPSAGGPQAWGPSPRGEQRRQGWDEPASRAWDIRGQRMVAERDRPGWEGAGIEPERDQPGRGRRSRQARGAAEMASGPVAPQGAAGEIQRGRWGEQLAGQGRGRSMAGGQPGEMERAWQWGQPEHPRFDELRARGRVSKRQLKRIEKAEGTVELSVQRAFEASERAMQHGHSRRARKGERKAVAQADRAQRMLEQHLLRVERQLASTRRRRRRGLGLVMLAGAGAGATVAVRRMMSQQNRPELRPDQQQPSAQTGMTTGAAFPGGAGEGTRMSGVAPDAMEDRQSRERMSDPQSTTHRF